MQAADLSPLRLWLSQTTGLQDHLLGRQRLERAVAHRLKALGCASPGAYHQRLIDDLAEQQQFLEELVVGESWFLREPRSFVHVQELAWRQRQRPLRLLSCGCSGGEEPYSLVIAMLEAGLTVQQLQVEAIDISAEALQRAAAALYGSHALRGMDAARLARFFEPEEGRWRLRSEIRAAVRFHRGALPGQITRLPGGWHAVFCRNVMLYLSPEARQQLLLTIADQLAPEGLLVVAAAEAPMVPADRYRRLEGGHGASFQRLERQAGVAPATAAGDPAAAARLLQQQPLLPLRSTSLPPLLASAGGRDSTAPGLPPTSLRSSTMAAAPAPAAATPIPAQAPVTSAAALKRPQPEPPPPEAPPGAAASLEPAAHLEQARRLQQQRRPEEALLALRRCLYLDPSRLEALELGAALARELGRHQEADRHDRRLQRSRQRRQSSRRGA